MALPDDWREYLEHIDALASSMFAEPIARRYGERALATGDNRVRTADDVLGERLTRVGGLLQVEHRKPGALILAAFENESREESLLRFAHSALTASPYLWTEDVRGALRELDVPAHVLSPRLLPQAKTWHTFETGIHTRGSLEVDGRLYVDETVDFVLVADAVRGLTILVGGEMRDAETGEPRPVLTGASLEYGKTWPDDFEAPVRNLAESVLTMFAFLASPYIPKRQERASRPARREAKRLGGSSLDDELVTFVVLRRPATRPSSSDEERSVEWKHRWLVSGHLRAQWYPSEQAHRLVWIAPYLKGPPDAPFLEHVYKVAR